MAVTRLTFYLCSHSGELILQCPPLPRLTPSQGQICTEVRKLQKKVYTVKRLKSSRYVWDVFLFRVSKLQILGEAHRVRLIRALRIYSRLDYLLEACSLRGAV